MNDEQLEKKPVPTKLLSLVLIALLAVVVLVMVLTNPETSSSESEAGEASATETTAESSTVESAAAESSSPSAASAEQVTARFVDDAKANPATPKTIVLLGDQTGASPQGWAPQMGAVFADTLDRPTATAYWNNGMSAYDPGMLVGNGQANGPTGFWNGSAAGQTAAYAVQNLAGLIKPDVTPDLILLNYGHTEDPTKPLAEQVQPLITALKQQYPNASIAVIKQNPTMNADPAFAQQLAGYASAMDVEGVQVIDVYSAFPTDPAQLSAVMESDIMPNAAGQKIWLNTVLESMGLPTQ